MNFQKLFKGNFILFKFYYEYLRVLLKIPLAYYSNVYINSELKDKKSFTVNINKSLIEDYKKGLKEVGDKLSEIKRSNEIKTGNESNESNESNDNDFDFKTKMILFFCLRIICVITAWYGSFTWTTIISLFQFTFLPYSLFVSLCYGINTYLSIMIGNLITFPLLKLLIQTIFPEWLLHSITITNTFIIIFFAVDQLLCFIFLFITPRGKIKLFSLERIIQSIIFGFLNTKTYHLIILLLSRGVEITIIVWIIDALLGISAIISTQTQKYWGLLFYHQHRAAHLPEVYFDAHKFHHFLHDTTAFDAHIYGNGAPEEWFMLNMEVIPAFFFGCIPPSLTYFPLRQSWDSKIGHTRKEIQNYFNLHADHHLYHTKIFSFEIVIDIIMKTAVNSEYNELPGEFSVSRKEIGDNIEITFVKL